MINIFLFVLFSFVTILPLTIFIHELGHFFFARICFVKNITIKIGTGNKLVQFKLKDLTVVLHKLPYGGVTFFELNDALTLPKTILISLGGPLLNGVIAFFLLLPGFGDGTHTVTLWFQWLAVFNLIMCVMNLIPYKNTKYYTDGWVIVNAIKNKKFKKF